MSPEGPVLVIACVILAVLASWALVLAFGAPMRHGRYATIDGLRGYLALAVFINHTAVWYAYVRTGNWIEPSSALYKHCGESSVALFFMITGFLFSDKIIDGKHVPLAWNRLYLSRLARLAPLYFFVVCVLFAVVAYLSGGRLSVSAANLVNTCLHWIAFTLLGGPDINHVENTSVIVGGVTWSLVYEWCAYGSLPILALCMGVSVPRPYLVLGMATIAAAFVLHLAPLRLLAFCGGIAAAFAVRRDTFCRAATTPTATALAIGCLGATVALCPNGAYAPLPMLLLSVVFIIVACGNSLCRTLTTSASRMLGDLSYSIYLIHGLVLFGVFRLWMTPARASTTSGTLHCVIAALCTPPLVFLAYATYRCIEVPGIRTMPRLMRSLFHVNRLSGPTLVVVDTKVPR